MTEPALFLIVKGDKHQAARAAADRGIPLAFIRENRRGTVETMGRTGEEHRPAVAAWFAETIRAPFPDGTLLHYSEDTPTP